MRSRVWAVATAVVLLASSAAIGGAATASAAPPEPLRVTATNTPDTPQAGSVAVTYDVNQSVRQIASVSITLDGFAVSATPLAAVTNKSSRGSVVFQGLQTGDHDVVVSVANRKGDTSSATTSFTIAGDPPTGVNIEGARAWCEGASGSFTAPDAGVGNYTENQVAFWSCLNADTVWVLGDPTDTIPPPIIIEIMSNYCSTTPPNYDLVLSSWVNYQGDQTLDNFACWKDLTPIQ